MRAVAAALVAFAYLGMCGAVILRECRRRQQALQAAAALTPAPAGAESMIVAFASQTGFAEELAWHAARSLHTAGIPVRVMSLSELTADALDSVRRALFVVSTCGEGDPPDNATLFARRLMGSDLALAGLHYGLLALGDRAYANFCGFGRSLDQWLQQRGAQRLFERVDVDNGSETSLREWQHHLGRVAGLCGLPDWQAPEFEPWRLVRRVHLNPGSTGGATFHVELEAPPGTTPATWQAGDLVQLLAPSDPAHPREYSIASLPADGTVHLLVRQEHRSDGRLGAASGWITQQAAIGSDIPVRLRSHRSFHLGDNAHRPMMLIGNGSGLAGLRSHIKARAAMKGSRNWLVFGERNAAHDFYHREEIEAWCAQGVLERVDLVFSRDQAQRRYVQHALVDAASTVYAWIAAGAAIYICGSLEGMAGGVEAALIEIAGSQTVERLIQEGRYRRDVY